MIDGLTAFVRSGADCVADLKHERRRKRRRRVDFAENNVVLDEDYGSFFRVLGVVVVDLPATKGADAADEDAIDPLYAQFLAQLRVHGKSYVCESAIDLHYEEEEERINKVPSPAIPGGSRIGRRKNAVNEPGDVPSNLHCEEDKEIGIVPKPETPEDSRSDQSERGGMTKGEYRWSDRRENQVNNDKDPGDFWSDVPIAANRARQRSQSLKLRKKRAPRKCPKRARQRNVKRKYEIESDDLDDSFDVFPNHVKRESEGYTFAHDDSPPVVYEENDDDGRSSDCEILLPESVLHRNDTPFEISRTVDFAVVQVDGRNGPGSQSVSSTFRDNLMDVLRRPYDKTEYNDLYNQASVRKPAQGRRILRHVTLSYNKKSCSKSLLEIHTGLAEKINLVSHDHNMVLNLLRGFFYWLENLPHQGSFCPWLDPLFLAAIGYDATAIDVKTEW